MHVRTLEWRETSSKIATFLFVFFLIIFFFIILHRSNFPTYLHIEIKIIVSIKLLRMFAKYSTLKFLIKPTHEYFSTNSAKMGEICRNEKFIQKLNSKTDTRYHANKTFFLYEF